MSKTPSSNEGLVPLFWHGWPPLSNPFLLVQNLYVLVLKWVSGTFEVPQELALCCAMCLFFTDVKVCTLLTTLDCFSCLRVPASVLRSCKFKNYWKFPLQQQCFWVSSSFLYLHCVRSSWGINKVWVHPCRSLHFFSLAWALVETDMEFSCIFFSIVNSPNSYLVVFNICIKVTPGCQHFYFKI